MIYNEHDVDFSVITSTQFENLCYEMLVLYGYQNVTWRQGGADSGRDIEAQLPFFSNFTNNHFTKWHFECKHYKEGVPPEVLYKNIPWAATEDIDFFAILITSYLSNNARTWLEKTQTQHSFTIIVIEGVELKRRIASFQQLIPNYFLADRYINLYHEIKRLNFKYYIKPSLEALNEIITNIDAEKFELEDIAFLLFSFYANYGIERTEAEEEFGGYDFQENLPAPLIERLKKISNQRDFTDLVKDISFLDGVGFINDVENAVVSWRYYQTYTIHLNYSDKDKWQLGYYLLVIINAETAFELFRIEDDWNNIYSYVYPEYNEEVLDTILSKFYDSGFIEEIKKNTTHIL